MREKPVLRPRDGTFLLRQGDDRTRLREVVELLGIDLRQLGSPKQTKQRLHGKRRCLSGVVPAREGRHENRPA